jgi:hypothetical protein
VIEIHLLANLSISRQRIHNNHARAPQRPVINHKAILQPLVLLQIIESLFLNARAIQDIGASDHFRCQFAGLDEQLAGLRFGDLEDFPGK